MEIERTFSEIIETAIGGVEKIEGKKKWEKKFRRRINAAGIIQNIVFSKHLLNPGVKLLSLFPRAINTLIDYTRK